MDEEKAGRRVLLVEDEFFLADDMTRAFRASGAEVVGPVGHLEDALRAVADAPRLDGAVLDVDLHGEMTFPVADALEARGVPFVFATGYDDETIPERFAHVARWVKPADARGIARRLLGAIEDRQ